jgi:hypothetical protein
LNRILYILITTSKMPGKGRALIMASGLVPMILFTCCNMAVMQDPRAVRAGEIIESAIHEAGLENDISFEFIVDRGLEAEPGDLNGETFEVSREGDRLTIRGAGPAGILYGSREAANLIGRGQLDTGMPIYESPRMNLRGIGLLLMKLGTYNYPVTPEEFPFFYDREQWNEYLDFLESNRYNYIAFWNGHPFSYFVELPEYQEAQDGMPGGLPERNRQQLHWLVGQARKRNIRIFFEFYNIHTSVYFQEHHRLPDETRVPTDLLAEYTAYSIGQFCREFPDVGLYITAGEGLNLEHTDQAVRVVIDGQSVIDGSGKHAGNPFEEQAGNPAGNRFGRL